MIKLILTDMDGTFLNSKGDFNRTLYKEVKELMLNKGVIFAPVSGKQCERVEELFGEDANDLWILGDSATRIKHQGEFIYESLLENKKGLRIISELEKISPTHTIIACTRQGAITKSTISPEEAQIVRGSYTNVKQVSSFSEITDDFIKITVHDPELRCFETKEKIAHFSDSAYIVASEAAWIDIANVNVHKGTTVEQLQKILNVTPQETVAFGDGYNDLELMVRADYSFAVRNAVDELKEVAHFITATNDQDAVMQTIIKLISLQADVKTSLNEQKALSRN